MLAQRALVRLVIALIAVLTIVGPVFAQAGGGGGMGGSGSGDQAIVPPALGQPKTVQVASSFGAAMESIPITVSPGRRGLTPSLTLSYSSMAGWGIAGLGWQIDPGRIEVYRGEGTPPVVADARDSYTYAVTGAGGRLVRADGTGLYRDRIETAYREFRKVAGGWTMVDGQGVAYSFGSDATSRLTSARGTEVWMLDRVTDALGNTIVYTYVQDRGVPYLSLIRYTGHGDEPGPNSVEFAYTLTRPDPRVLYARSVREELTRRLDTITVRARGQLAARYELRYAVHPLSGLSLLTEVLLAGADADTPPGEGQEPPAQIALRTFTYTDRQPGWSTTSTAIDIPALVDEEGRDTGVRLVDVDGDAFVDVVDPSATDGSQVKLGDGGTFASSAAWSASLKAAGIAFVKPDGRQQGADTGVRLMDVDGDARPDLLIAQPSRREVRLNTGTGWQAPTEAPSSTWTANVDTLASRADAWSDQTLASSVAAGCSPPPCDGPYGAFEGCTPTDATFPPECTVGDEGCCQPLCTTADLAGGTLWNNLPGAGTVTIDEPFSLVDVDGDSRGVEFADVNGDGRLDIVWAMTQTERLTWMFGGSEIPIQIRGVFLNTGSGWERDDNLTSELWRTFASDGKPVEFAIDTEVQGWGMADANGDGLADLVRTWDEAAREVLVGTGRGWLHDGGLSDSLTAASKIVSLSGASRTSLGLMPGDFNDDGLIDYIRSSGSVERTWAYVHTGNGWIESPALEAAFGLLGVGFVTTDGKPTGVSIVDVNGDGLSDIIAAKGADAPRLWLAGGPKAGLLATARTALLEQTELTWGVSSAFDNRGTKDAESGIALLPAAIPVVTAITRSVALQDGTVVSGKTTYAYDGGRFQERALRGFGHVRETADGGETIDRYFHQEEALVGVPSREEACTSDGTSCSISLSADDVVPRPGDIRQVQFTTHSELTTDPGMAGVFGWSARTDYDPLLRAVRTRRALNLTVDPTKTEPAYDLEITTSWAENRDAGIWGLLAETTTKDVATDAVLTQDTIQYDGVPGEPLALGEVTEGLPTRMRELAKAVSLLERNLAYDRYGNTVEVRDRNGNVTRFWYDDTHTFKVRALDAEGRESRTEYDARFGIAIQDTDAAGRTSSRTLDAFGRTVTETLPGDEATPNGTTSIRYSALDGSAAPSYQVRETERSGAPGTLDRTVYFDGFGQVYRVEREGAGATIVETAAFDVSGNVLRLSRPFFDGDTPVYSTIDRDDLGRPVKVTEPDGRFVTIVYHGPWVATTDLNGNPTSVRRDPFGNTLEIRQGAAGSEVTTTYRYDLLGRLVRIRDALGEETRITYDSLGRRTKLVDPTAGTTGPGTFEYRYDGEGNLVSQTGPDRRVTQFEYDRTGDLVAKRLPDGTTIKLTYGAPGEPSRIEDAAGTLALTYDARGNVAERARTVLGSTYVTRYAYDSLGQPIEITYPDGFIVRYEYDAGGNLTAVRDGSGRSIADLVGHNASGQVGSTTFGNGDTTTYMYDVMQRLTTLASRAADGALLQDLVYAFDPGGNVLSITDGAFGASQSFAYDSLNRLVKATGAYGTETYEYDAIGNLLRMGDRLFAVDPNHPQRVICGVNMSSPRTQAVKLTSTNCGAAVLATIAARPSVAGVDARSSFNIRYDAMGNLVAKGDRTYRYDAENRLVHVRSANGAVIESNVYDLSGNRVVQLTGDAQTIFIDGIYEVGKTHVSRHVFAGSSLVATIVEPKAAVALVQPTGSPPVGVPLMAFALGLPLLALRWTRRHPRAVLRAVSVLAAAALLTQAVTPSVAASPGAEEQRFYYHPNQLGSVDVVTDDKGHEIERRAYKPYGESYAWEGAHGGPRELVEGFAGHELDDATSLFYFGARFYDPQLGRFITADTQIPDPLNPIQLHRYAYAGDNPVRYVDPTGHAWWDWVLTALVFVLAVVLVIVTFGSAAPLVFGIALALTLGGALIGGCVAAGLAASKGISPLSSAFWKQALLGVAIGAAIGAGIASIFLGPAAVGSTTTTLGFFATKIALGALAGGATGTIAAIVGTTVSGGSVDSLFGLALFKEYAIGAALGGALAGVGGGLGYAKHLKDFRLAGKGTTLWMREIMQMTTRQIGKPGFFWVLGRTYDAANVAYAFVGSAFAGSPHKLMPDVFGAVYPTGAKAMNLPPSLLRNTYPGQAAGGSNPNPDLVTLPLAP
jgi:RHS repeat-associated protein